MMKKAAKKTSTRPDAKSPPTLKLRRGNGGISIKKYCEFCAAPRGQTIIIATVFIAALLVLSLSIVNRGANVSQENRLVNQKISARALAEAGVEKAIYCLNQNVGTNCGGTFGVNYVGESDIPLNDGEFTTTITTISGNTKSITSTGYIPNSSNPKNTVAIKTQATINAETVTFNYGVQNGIGGLEMYNSSKIIGNIYSNGSIIGHNSAEITGDATVAGGTAVAADQSDTAQNSSFTFGTSSPRLDIAQSFQVSTNNQINKVSFYIKKIGAPSNLTVRILTDNNGKPSKTALASGTLNASQVTTSYGWVDVSFSNPPPVFTSQTYWVSIDTSADASRYWIIGLDNQDGYTAGKAMASANWNATTPIWSDAGGDFNFKIWLGGLTTKISTIKVGGDVRAHNIEGVDVGRDAYADTIHMDSIIRRDARAALIDDSTVIRDAYADTITGSTVGHEYPGGAQPDPAPIGMPISDGQMQEWKDAADDGAPITGPVNLALSDQLTIGPKKIIGDVSLVNSASIKLTGPVWITGSLTLGNTTKIYIDPAMGAQGTIIIVTGKISVGNQAELAGSGTSGSYLLVISEDPGITDGNEAITMGNGTATAVLYAPYGAVTIPNSVELREVTAYKLKTYNTAIIRYESGLAHATFSSGPGGSWVLKKGTWQEL